MTDPRSTDLPFPPKQRPAAVFVLGNDASAVALCTAALELLGARPPPAGEVAALCEKVLGLLGRAGAGPVADYPLAPAWWADARLDALIPAARALLGTGSPLLADPRLARLLPFWLRAAREAGFAPRVVIALGPPPCEMSAFGALDQLVDALRYSATCARCRVVFAEWFTDPAVPWRRLVSLLAAAEPPPEGDALAALAALRDREGPHAAGPDTPAGRQPLMRHVFGLALSGATLEEANGRLASFVEQFVAFRQLLAPFEKAQVATVRALALAEARVRDGQERGRGLEKAQNATTRLERARDGAERARMALEAALDISRAAERTAEARVARLEADLAEHASALSDALARLRDAEARAVVASLPMPPAEHTPRGWRRALRLD